MFVSASENARCGILFIDCCLKLWLFVVCFVSLHVVFVSAVMPKHLRRVDLQSVVLGEKSSRWGLDRFFASAIKEALCSFELHL